MEERPGSLTSRERVDRSRARGWALQVLYRWESGEAGRDPLDVLAEVVELQLVAERRLPHTRRVLEAVRDHRATIDRELEGVMRNWRLDRVSRIDRSILRIGAAELLHLDDVPPRVAIQEAVRLAERYGGDESPGFVNGILDGLFHGRSGRS